MIKRFLRWFKAVIYGGMEKLENPELMLDQARREMQEALVASREKAVQAITQKNRLQTLVDEASKRSELIEEKAILALKKGDRELAKDFLKEKANNDQTLASLKETLHQAQQTVETIKHAIKYQEEEVRKKTAETLAMKAQWKQAQIQNSITKALEGLTFESQFEPLESISEKIRMTQSEAAARQEVLSDTLKGKTIKLEAGTADLTAEAELNRLEKKLMAEPHNYKALEKGKDQTAHDKLTELEKRLEDK